MLESMGIAAQKAAWQLAESSSAAKNKLLLALADKLAENTQFILEANAKDIAIAQENGMSTALLDRLVLNEQRLASIIADVRHVASLKDPVGELIDGSILDNGLDIKRRRVPLGVIGVIYEARPNVTIDIAALCLKTGNAVILRGGKETMHSNKALVEIIQQVLLAFSLPAATVQFIDNPDRALVTALLRLDKYVDMIIPRGGAALQRLCREQATIPVIIGGIGVCHIFVDKSANLDKALEIIINAKTQRPSTCNSVETLLIHQDLAPDFLAILGQHLAAHGVTIHIEAELAKLYAPAFERSSYLESVNYDEEWLSLDLNLKVVSGLDAAIAHIREHGTGHSEAILTTDMLNADLFVRRVDAAALYVNASTRFTDGAQFGLGAEVAVSTQKLHARGPMGLEALTTYKWIAYGDNLTRS